MGFLKNLFTPTGALPVERREETPVAGVPSTTAPENQTQGSGSFAENISYVTSQEVALRIATFYRCMELRANTMAQLTPQYQSLNYEGGNYVEYNRGACRILNYLLQRQPNPLMSAFEFWRQVEIETVARGNAFILIERDVFGMPKAFWLASSGSYDQMGDTYLLTYNGLCGPQTTTAASADVIHVCNTFRRQGGMVGISTLQYAREMLSLSATLDRSAMETAAKGGRMKLLIGEEKQGSFGLGGGLYNKKRMDDYAKDVQTRLYANDVVAMRGLDKVQNISMSATDMQLFDQRQFGVAEICRMMSVPRTLAMDGSNSSYKSPEADRLDFLMNCIQPKRRLLEDELNRKLLTPADFGRNRIHLCELPLMMFDKKGQATIDQLNLQTGAMTVNEIRKQYDMPAVKDGDTVYVSTNLAELGSEKLRSNGGGSPAEGGGMVAATNDGDGAEGGDE